MNLKHFFFPLLGTRHSYHAYSGWLGLVFGVTGVLFGEPWWLPFISTTAFVGASQAVYVYVTDKEGRHE